MAPPQDDSPHDLLTPRQLEVLELMAKGLLNREIAKRLGISASTVKTHVAAVIEALDVSNRTEAATRLHELGLGSARNDAADERRIEGFGSRPAIAILPFDDFSTDPDSDFLADAIVEDLTTGLANWRWFPVISRNSALVYKGRPISVREVGEALGATYVVEGSVRAAGQQVRISVQVLEAANGHHVWAQEIDCARDGILEGFDAIVDQIVASLEPALVHVGGVRTFSRRPNQLDVWENTSRGLHHLSENTLEGWLAAAECYDRALSLDPQLPAAHSGLAFGRMQAYWHGIDLEVQNQPTGFRESAELTERLDPRDFETHLATAPLWLVAGEPGRSLVASARCIELCPSSPWGYYHHALALSASDRPDEAAETVTRALRTARDDAYHALATTLLAACRLARGRVEEASELFTRAVGEVPSLASAYSGLAVCRLLAGEPEEAQAMLVRMQEASPGYRPLRVYRTLASDAAFAASKATFAAMGWTEAEFE